MEKRLTIENSSCIKCGRCVKVCPAMVLMQKDKHSEVQVRDINTCIVCGHCVASCPTGSVNHSFFPSDKVHKVDTTLMPTPEQVMLLCKARRSNRVFSQNPIPVEKLDMILEAAHRAPTASNMQQVEFTIITDPKKLEQITDFTISIFGSVVNKLKSPLLKPILKMIMPGAYNYLPAFTRLIEQRKSGNDMILRNATAVILIHTASNSRFGEADANLAYQNGSLMAESLGVSQFYMGFVCAALKQDKKRTLEKLFGIDGQICAAMALGLPDFRFPNYIDKKDIKVTRM